jgi:hypothetical protein
MSKKICEKCGGMKGVKEFSGTSFPEIKVKTQILCKKCRKEMEKLLTQEYESIKSVEEETIKRLSKTEKVDDLNDYENFHIIKFVHEFVLGYVRKKKIKSGTKIIGDGIKYWNQLKSPFSNTFMRKKFSIYDGVQNIDFSKEIPLINCGAFAEVADILLTNKKLYIGINPYGKKFEVISYELVNIDSVELFSKGASLAGKVGGFLGGGLIGAVVAKDWEISINGGRKVRIPDTDKKYASFLTALFYELINFIKHFQKKESN